MVKVKQNKHKTGFQEQGDLAETLDSLAEFQEFKERFLPEIRKDLTAGLSAQQIYKKYSSLAAARTVMVAIREVDSGKALAASKEIIDRAEGKVTENVKHTHRFEELSDDELDAQILSRAEELEEPADADGEGLH